MMFISEAREYRYIIAARNSLTYITEDRVLKRADAKSIIKFFWKQIIYQYSYIVEVVTDNDSEVKEVLEHSFTIEFLKLRYLSTIKISKTYILWHCLVQSGIRY